MPKLNNLNETFRVIFKPQRSNQRPLEAVFFDDFFFLTFLESMIRSVHLSSLHGQKFLVHCSTSNFLQFTFPTDDDTTRWRSNRFAASQQRASLTLAGVKAETMELPQRKFHSTTLHRIVYANFCYFHFQLYWSSALH